LQVPREQEAIINDTVGFMSPLTDLTSAFERLKETGGSSVLIHAVDVANPRWPQY
jgi:50S ribosomal subunit-associated GTPase HflX